MIVVEIVFQASTDARDAFMDLARRAMSLSRLENGCILYRFAADLELPNRFVLMEIWETEEDLKAHSAGAAFKGFFAELPGKGNFVGYTAWQGPLVSYRPLDEAE